MYIKKQIESHYGPASMEVLAENDLFIMVGYLEESAFMSEIKIFLKDIDSGKRGYIGSMVLHMRIGNFNEESFRRMASGAFSQI